MAEHPVAPEFRFGPGIDSSLKSMTVTQVLARARRRCERCETPETESRGSYKLTIVYRDGKLNNVDLDNLTLVCSSCLRPGDVWVMGTGPPVASEPSLGTGSNLGTVPLGTGMRRAVRRSQKIQRVTDSLLRSRIEKIKYKSVRMCVKYLYVIDGRVSEAVSLAYPSDVETTPRGCRNGREILGSNK